MVNSTSGGDFLFCVVSFVFSVVLLFLDYVSTFPGVYCFMSLIHGSWSFFTIYIVRLEHKEHDDASVK